MGGGRFRFAATGLSFSGHQSFSGHPTFFGHPCSAAIRHRKYSASQIVTDYTIIILLTLFGFLALAAILLVPIYRFLRREEMASRRWTQDEIARRGSRTSVNGGAPSKRPRGDDTAVDDEP